MSHLETQFPALFEVYKDISIRREKPTLLEVRIAKGMASSEEISQHVLAVRARNDALMRDFGQVSSYSVELGSLLMSTQTGFDHETFTQILSDWVVACDQPFEEVERPEFRRLLQYLRGPTHLATPSARTLKRHIDRLSRLGFNETVELIKVCISLFHRKPYTQHTF